MELPKRCLKGPMGLCKACMEESIMNSHRKDVRDCYMHPDFNDGGCNFEFMESNFGIEEARKICPAYILETYPELIRKYSEAMRLNMELENVRKKADEIAMKDREAEYYLCGYVDCLAEKYVDAFRDFYNAAIYRMSDDSTRWHMRTDKVQQLWNEVHNKAESSLIPVNESGLHWLVVEHENAPLHLE